MFLFHVCWKLVFTAFLKDIFNSKHLMRPISTHFILSYYTTYIIIMIPKEHTFIPTENKIEGDL